MEDFTFEGEEMGEALPDHLGLCFPRSHLD